ncbi:hypothetical protein LPJ81_002394 [Coemansia sp. IMI 209127]|nr:hypothetical protein LPJ81_002394 [Coemansia sp. IMI 209127]
MKEHSESFVLDRAISSTFRLSKLNEKSFQGVREAGMYPLFKDFVMLVAHHVNPPHETHIAETSSSAKRKRARSDNEPDPAKPGVAAKRRRIELRSVKLSDKARGKRAEHVGDSNSWQPSLVLPYGPCDVKLEGSDSKTRVDLALSVCSSSTPVKPLEDPKYKDVFAIVEMKRLKGEQQKAYEQLVEYTRGIYANQIHRRYAWGLTMCGTEVRCCLFHHDGIKATRKIDFSTSDGREKLVTLLVHWSCCGSARLGYDTTILRDKTNKRWNISCPNLKGDKTLTYYTTGMVLNATSLFGRHTRCYLAKLKDDDSDKEFVIKDAWSLPRDLKKSTGAPPDEAYNLREITQKFDGQDMRFSYPRAVSSGVVEILDGGRYVNDDTSQIYKFKDSDKQMLFREHRRIVMTPVGRYIKQVKNVFELVLVLDDATKWTLPYMSIHNLEGAEGKRTRLDDWESLLYLICWLGTFGINDDDRKNTKKDKIAEINKWRSEKMKDIAECKRKHMDSLESFKKDILAGFQDDYMMLKALAASIYEALFQWEGCVKGASLEEEFHMPSDPFKSAGIEAIAMFQSGQSSKPKPKRDDPLVSRLEHEGAIVDKLLDIMKDASAVSERVCTVIDEVRKEKAQEQEQS